MNRALAPQGMLAPSSKPMALKMDSILETLPGPKIRPCPFCQAPQFSAPPLNPTKQTTNRAKEIRPTVHAINTQRRTIELVLRRANTMQENIRKFVETGTPLCPLAGCPILAVPLFLRQGWETTEASPVLVFAFGPSAALRPRRSAPRQNVAKSVAKARKTHQVTTPQPQTYQSHSSHFPQKTPHPPLFRPKAGLNRTRNLTRSKGKTCCPRSAFDSIG